ncbi:hypothetical protein QBC46DRAFT_400905 [Diplogelasinospora grovesii]|uniref:Uncharacterized protein n=1 Tax=Diplogelasinospora grovesii TaxID=303347 RepID=A0AAN6MV07_9PEZI|nr:hypothetical protein QBC46DRAFT_400905 [Diplogelasinospora grovesii]
MATLLAPYNTAMQLGSGFNSYTQQLCINNAVVRDNGSRDPTAEQKPKLPMAQEVTYKTSVIDKVTDVTNAMNINPAFSIKYDAFDVKGKGDFINTSKVKESDISFMISVKVVNQVIYDHSLVKFDPIPEVKVENFAQVYGDSFISGFQEGGEFTAVISIKAKDRRKANKLKADAAINFTKDKLELHADGEFGKDDTSFLTENETTVSVTWTGGGQDLKKPSEDWTLDNMRNAALRFPNLVAETPMRTHAILTKYTALRSFQAILAKLASGGADLRTVIPSFEKAGVYTTVLQEAYLDFKTVLKNLQVLAYSVSSGSERLVESPAEKRALVESEGSDEQKLIAESSQGEDSDSGSMVSVGTDGKAPRRATKPYPATIAGLEQARQDARFMLNRIVTEIDTITRNPELAVLETRSLPYLSPFLFKELLPEGRPVKERTPTIVAPTGEEVPASQDNAPATEGGLGDLSDKLGTTMRF